MTWTEEVRGVEMETPHRCAKSGELQRGGVRRGVVGDEVKVNLLTIGAVLSSLPHLSA